MVQERKGRFLLRVKHRLLPKPYHSTFDTEAEARKYGEDLEARLNLGIVPWELLEAKPTKSQGTFDDAIGAYLVGAPVTASDAELLPVVRSEVGPARLSDLTFPWVDAYVRKLKLEKNLSPGTIRKRIGCLARVIDWHLKRVNPAGAAAANPLRLLSLGYSHYTETEKKLLGKGKTAKVDVSRDIRLTPEAEARVRWALEGGKREDRERGIADPALYMLFDLSIESGLRLSEMYRLRINQLDFAKGIIRVEGSKGARGLLKPRTVPMKAGLQDKLKNWCFGRSGMVFPFWDGTKESMRRTSSKLSFRFRTLFEYAGVEDMTEHDLRHEACCRWVELRGPDGRWVFSDLEVCKIMGWSGMGMMLRYASLRGEDLASRLH